MDAAIKARTVARIWVTRQGNKVLAMLEKASLSKVDYQVELEDFHKRVEALNHAQCEVEVHLPPENIESDLEAADNYFTQHVKKVLVATRPKELEELEDAGSGSGRSTRVEAKLPKLTLPKFGGEVLEWRPFWEQFLAIIDARDDLEDVRKFAYLNSYLVGDAKMAIAGLSQIGDSYAAACAILKERFGRPEKIIFAHVQALLGVQVPDRPSVEALWTLYSNLQSHIRSLEALSITGEQYGVILTPLILSRLPASLRLEWAREGERSKDTARLRVAAGSQGAADAEAGAVKQISWEADLGFLMDFLGREIRQRETSQTYSDADGQLNATTSSAAALVSSTRGGASGHSGSAQSSASSSGCLLCVGARSKHSTQQCPRLKDLSLKGKRDLLWEYFVCTKCLRKTSAGHSGKCTGKCAHCNGPHHSALCNQEKSHPKHNSQKKSSDSKSHSVSLTSSASLPKQDVLLQTLKISVGGKGGKKKVLVLFDTGADRTYISQDLVNCIKPEFVDSAVLSCASFGAKKRTAAERKEIYNILLEGDGNGIAINATCVPTICAPLYQPSVPANLLRKIPFADLVSVPAGHNLKVDVLVGMDAYWSFFTAEVSRVSDELVAHRTHFGWVLSGRLPASGLPTQPRAGEEVAATQLFCQGVESSVVEPVESLWALEAIGIADVKSVDDHVWSDFESTVTKVDGRYAVGLPWKEGMADRLKPNRANAQKRLDSLENRLGRDEDLSRAYDEFFRFMEEQGIVEEVPAVEVDTLSPVYYLPHHPVVKVHSSSTKVRPVFDASAKSYNGISLNDCMSTGPNLLPDLVSLLLRFRRWKVALTADVVKAFLQVSVHPADRDVHRFLWKERVMRFTRVPFGNRASPFLLCATIRHHLSLYPQSLVVTELRDNLYMDDWLTGCDSEALAQSMFLDAQKVMLEAGMTLSKWTSNGLNFSDKVAETTKVLGMKWTPDTDVFSFDGVMVPSTLCLTKRSVLSLISRLFDPLGLLNPFSIRAKILFQSLWRENLGWDQSLPPEWKDWLGDWVGELALLKQWSIPRKFFACLWSERPTLVIHGFGDASPQAYGACIYLLAKGADDSEPESCLVISRARVAPIKPVTLPRLELLGALLCARLMQFVRKSLNLDDSVPGYCWTDSTVALAWICTNEPHKWKTFVANRVLEIHQLTDPKQWRHCPGKDNPADLVTRGISASELIDSKCWTRGPLNVMLGVADPVNSDSQVSDKDIQVVEQEMRPPLSAVLTVKSVEPVLQIERHSKWVKALRVVAYVLRFLHEVEGCVNSRPLTFVGDAFADSGRQLTPTHFLLGRSSPLAKGKVGDTVSSEDQLIKLSQHQSELATEFWQEWRDSYLKNLRPHVGVSSGEDIKEGAVVLIDCEGPRLSWPLGVVEKIHPSRDGLTRTVTLRTAKGHFTRPIQRICRLEMNNPPSFSKPDPSICQPELSLSQSPLSDAPSQTTQTPVPTNQAHTGREKTTRSGRTVKPRKLLNLHTRSHEYNS